jgi:hypothetical protein
MFDAREATMYAQAQAAAAYVWQRDHDFGSLWCDDLSPEEWCQGFT